MVFLKIKENKTKLIKFLLLAIRNYLPFLKIYIFMGFILLLISVPFFISLPLIFPAISRETAIIYLNPIVGYCLIALLTFAYPLVIIGYFSKQKLKPIRSSILMFIKNINKTWFILTLMALNKIIGYLIKVSASREYIDLTSIASRTVYALIYYIIIVYSYIFIMEYLHKDFTYYIEEQT